MAERALVIREPWIDLILQGKKTWEMRSQPTSVRGKIGLIRRGTGLVVGTAMLTDCRTALSRDNYMQHSDKHAIPASMLEEVLANRWVFPWVLSDVRRLPKPVPYQHKSGAVIFVTLDPPVVAAIAMQDVGTAAGEADAVEEGADLSSMPPSRGVAAEPAQPPAMPPISASRDTPLFVFRPEEAQAFGRPLPRREFVVLAGSTAMRCGTANVKRDRDERDRLVREGVLVPDTDPRLYRFTRDCRFTSVSKASGVIKDGNASGPSLWKDEKTGQTLKDYLLSR